MRYRLRTLLIVLALAPAVLAVSYWTMPVLAWLGAVIAGGLLADSVQNASPDTN